MKPSSSGPGGAPYTAPRIAQLAADGGLPVPLSDHQAVANLLNALAVDMAPLRRLAVGEREPATFYQPAVDAERGHE